MRAGVCCKNSERERESVCVIGKASERKRKNVCVYARGRTIQKGCSMRVRKEKKKELLLKNNIKRRNDKK